MRCEVIVQELVGGPRTGLQTSILRELQHQEPARGQGARGLYLGDDVTQYCVCDVMMQELVGGLVTGLQAFHVIGSTMIAQMCKQEECYCIGLLVCCLQIAYNKTVE